MTGGANLDGWYPLLLNISGQLCVVAGGGSVAERKTKGLLAAGGRVRVISPSLTPALAKLAQAARIEWRRKEAEPADLEGALLVFAATDDSAANRRLAEMAKAKGLLVNDAGEGEAGNFIVPAVLRRGDFVLAAATGGSAPALAARVIRDLAAQYGPEDADYAAALRRIREAVKNEVADPEERKLLLLAAAEEPSVREWVERGGMESGQTVEWLRSLVHTRRPSGRTSQ